MNVIDLLSREKEKTAGEVVEEWRKELWEALPEIFCDEDDRYGVNDDGDIAIRKGGATLFVNFGLDEDQGAGWVLAYSPLVHMPEEALLPFYRKLLDINYDESVMGRLSTHEDVVYIARAQNTEGCNVRALISMVAELAEEADGIAACLIKEFGARATEIDVIAA